MRELLKRETGVSVEFRNSSSSKSSRRNMNSGGTQHLFTLSASPKCGKPRPGEILKFSTLFLPHPFLENVLPDELWSGWGKAVVGALFQVFSFSPILFLISSPPPSNVVRRRRGKVNRVQTQFSVHNVRENGTRVRIFPISSYFRLRFLMTQTEILHHTHIFGSLFPQGH